jgi:hypothetical protein
LFTFNNQNFVLTKQQEMEQINLKSLVFNSYEDYAYLGYEAVKNNLSYEITCLIDVHEVNRVINILKKNNTDLDINEIIQSKDFSDFIEYQLDVNTLTNSSINKEEIHFLSVNAAKKQIRA